MIIYFSLFFSLVQAQTTFIFHEGQCFEVDTETYGQKLAAKVLTSKCRPNKVIKKWNPDQIGIDGTCYEVDEETQGQKYLKKVNQSECTPPNHYTEWITLSDGQGICLLRDKATNGQTVTMKTDKKKCVSKQSSFVWKPNESNPLNGKCYQVDPVTNAIINTNDQNCRPKSLSYLWVPNKRRPLEGYCYEIDGVNGVAGYSKSTNKEACKARDLGFQFDPTSGECRLNAVSLDNQPMQLKANLKDCDTQEKIKIFIRESPIAGSCYEISKQDQGQSYKKLLPDAECRPPEGKWSYQVLTIKNVAKCFALPTSGYDSQYIESVDINYCQEKTSKYRWQLKTDGRGGQCFQSIAVGDKIFEQTTSIEKCKTSEIYQTWYNFGDFDGGCFEVDKKSGPQGFFNQIDSKFCKPIFTKFIFVKNYGKLGQCFEVDEETMGKKYHRKAGIGPCRENLKTGPL